MRGWKVLYEESKGRIHVGPNRGEVLDLQVLAVARSEVDGHVYVVYSSEDEFPERYEAPLLDYLSKRGGSWDLVPVEAVEPRWEDLPIEKRVASLKSEGFDITTALP